MPNRRFFLAFCFSHSFRESSPKSWNWHLNTGSVSKANPDPGPERTTCTRPCLLVLELQDMFYCGISSVGIIQLKWGPPNASKLAVTHRMENLPVGAHKALHFKDSSLYWFFFGSDMLGSYPSLLNTKKTFHNAMSHYMFMKGLCENKDKSFFN